MIFDILIRSVMNAGKKILNDKNDNRLSDKPTPNDIENYISDVIYSGVSSGKSLSDIAKKLRVEPLTIVSTDADAYEDIDTILKAVHYIYSGYYLQALTVLARIDSIRTINALDSLATESMQLKHSLESAKYDLNTALEYTPVKDDGNEFIGKVFEVDVTNGNGNTIKLPIMIRLAIRKLPFVGIKDIVDINSTNKRFLSRFEEWRSGGIEFWKDLVLGLDLIKEQKKILTKDDESIYKQLIDRQKKLAIAIAKGKIKHNIASDILVVTEEEAKQLETLVGGTLHKKRYRDKFFKMNYFLMVAVIDREWDTVSLYTRDIENYTTFRVKSIKKSNRIDNTDVMDLMKTFMSGGSPVL